MSLTPGINLAHYEILEPIGKGGMGEVYRARDGKLGRDVAIKVLPEELSQDKERLARFEREARLLAQLNHPNIATLHGLEQSHGQQFLVMELVDGETLAERIARGPVRLDEALSLARQVAKGLEAAHEKGIIHRDLKPANIKATADEQVKILDFGLAKVAGVEADSPGAGASQSPTLTKGTVVGAIMGTAAYMSPEQARGKTVDKRCDIWAFGAVLYEMLTGRRAFEGSDASEILAGVIKSEPSWERLPGDTPPTLKLYLQRCLQKNPKERVRDIGDVRLALDGAFETSKQSPVRSWSVLAWAVAGIALIVAIVSIWSRNSISPDQVPARFAIPVSGQLPPRVGTLVAISPDGRELVYVAITEDGDQLYHRSMNRLEAVAIPGTEGARRPFFSPNGQWVGFASADGDLKKVPLSGGPPTTLCSCSPGPVAVWGENGTIVFQDSTTFRLMRVSSDGGTPEPITTLTEGESIHGELTFLPNGEEMIFAVWSGSLSTTRLEVLSLSTGKRRPLGDGFFPRYSPTGHLIYGHSSGSLMAVRFDTDRLEMIGNPVRVLDDVRIEAGGSVQFDFADNGSAVYIAGGLSRAKRKLVWVDRDGREEPLGASLLEYNTVQVSPDGTRIALEVLGSAIEDVWLYDVAGETASQLTFDPYEDRWPLWTPDGQHVLFLSLLESGYALFSKRADGTGQSERLTSLRGSEIPWSIDPAGATLTYHERNPETGWDLGSVSLKGEPLPRTLLATEFAETNPQISPDGRWLAYTSDESGRREIYVSPFPNLGDGKWRVSRESGTEPLWSADGRELFYRDGRAVLAVSVETTSAFGVGDPQVLFSGPYWRWRTARTRGRTYDVTPDGERFVMIRESETDIAGSEIIVIQNWLDELERLVPTDNE